MRGIPGGGFARQKQYKLEKAQGNSTGDLGIKMLDCPIARLYTGKYVLTLSGTAFCLVSGAAVTRRIGIQLNLTGLLKPKQGRVFEVNPGVSGKIRQL